jgi:SAM-dependent methyltransferase
VPGPEAAHPEHWFEPLADHLGSAYLRYSFTKGTEQEVTFLVDALDLEPGMRVLDVGCGPGRHALALAARGIEVVGVDISARFVQLASDAARDLDVPATFLRADARHLAFGPEFDGAISLCQGAFGLQGVNGAEVTISADGAVLAGLARSVKPGGRVALSAFSAYFQVRFLDELAAFDAAHGVHHERTTVRDPDGREAEHDLWTTCFTPRELRLLAERAGLRVDRLWTLVPGKYADNPPDLEHPEFLVLASKP